MCLKKVIFFFFNMVLFINKIKMVVIIIRGEYKFDLIIFVKRRKIDLESNVCEKLLKFEENLC